MAHSYLPIYVIVYWLDRSQYKKWEDRFGIYNRFHEENMLATTR